MTYNVFGGTFSLTQPQPIPEDHHIVDICTLNVMHSRIVSFLSFSVVYV